MSLKVVLVAGTARSGKTAHLLNAYRRVLATGEIGAALWLAPNYRGATAIQSQLLLDQQPGWLRPNCLTFSQFAEGVLAAAAPQMRPISPLLVRSLLKRLIDQNVLAGQLTYFAPIAETRGLVDLMVGFIGELKRLEIWPEELADAHGHRASEKDRELCQVYRQYQDLLLRHHLYDAQGRFWTARALLREGKWGPFDRVRHIFVDGFTDFTRTEHEVLEILSSRAESLSISLPLEADASRGDLFIKTTRTMQELARRHPRLAVHHLPRRPGNIIALDHLERGLFGNLKRATAAPDTSGIEIIAAAGVTDEIESIARRIKGLLVQWDGGNPRHVVPGDILVVFRSLAETADLVRDVFGRYGIPHVVASAQPLKAAPIARALVAWLRLDAEDWPFRQSLAVLSHNYFRPSWPEWRRGSAAGALEQLVRELEISSGRGQLVNSVERLAARTATEAGAKRRLSSRLLRAQLAAPLLRKMCEALDQLPDRATPNDWAAALDDFARSTGLFAAAQDGPPGGESAAQDEEAWKRLKAALAEWQRLSVWMGEAPPRWTRRELLDAVEDALGHEQLPLPRDEAGRVRVLSAEAARNLSAPYVFLAGLAEKAFPPAGREDCIHSDAERRKLAEAGLPIAFHALDSRFEMLLFYEMVTRATRQLVLSYPALDPAAQPLTPSPYLSEVDRACGAGRVISNAQPHPASVPADDDVRSPRDFRVRAVSQALSGEPALLAELSAHRSTRATAGNLLSALAMSEARRGESFGPFDGMVDSKAAGQRLAERFGPDRCWTPSQLEQYAYCPFRFFMENVLHAKAATEPELAVDHMERGRILHWLLSTAHRRLNEQAGEPTSLGTADRERFMEIVASLVDELRGSGSDRPLERGMMEIDLRKNLTSISDYYQQHVAYDSHWKTWSTPPRPAYFEVSFGPRRRDDAIDEAERVLDESDPLSTLDPFELDCGGETIGFSGRIDRIDLGNFLGQGVFNIVDYKSGAGSKRHGLQAVLEGNALQLPLYAMAARWLLRARQAEPFRAGYWHVGGKGFREKDALKLHVIAEDRLAASGEWQTLESQIGPRVRSLVLGVRGGEFPMHSADEDCTGKCPFHTVCRVNQVRSLGKTWQPPSGESP